MFLKDFFYMQRSDRRAILFILVLMAAAAIILSVADMDTSFNEGGEPRHDSAQVSIAHRHNATDDETETMADTRKAETFCFDPNTADSTTLARLGLQTWQIRNIYRYRAKGGVYRSKEDFAYVYGLTVRDYKRLAPYIRIAAEYQPAYTLDEVQAARKGRRTNRYDMQPVADVQAADAANEAQHRPYSPKIHKGQFIAINKADTNELKKIPGIGSYYARQTVRYRKQLGGFVSKAQLLEIEGFPEEAMSFIEIDKDGITKLNVNRLTLAQMRSHPYINYYQARAIVDYRRLHGNIKDLHELRLLKEFSDDDFKRIEPYVEY